MTEIFLLKLGELVLKGLNRGRFEARLTANLKRRLEPHGRFEIYSLQSTVYVEPIGEIDGEAVFATLRRVFGVTSVCRAAVAPKDMDAISERAKAYLADALNGARTFKVEAKRADKTFALNSPQICALLGERLIAAFPHLKVDVRNPDVLAVVEVRDRAAYIHTAAAAGAGGLPVGVNGRAVLLLSGGIDSPAAGFMMAKRGLDILPVHFFSYPYTGIESKNKVLELARIMSAYTGRRQVMVVPFTAIQETIRGECPERLFTLVMRRFMMRIAERIAADSGCGALVTGESLGQVASQTLESLRVTEAVCGLPVLRPLVGMDKEEIVSVARRIGTFETSILPYEDCCTVFTPKHPKTKPSLEELEAAERALDAEGLIDGALAGIEKCGG
ncbi:MAG: tRNA 4-thiouridine(8) synthase ThiI [Oscillospiraceae bacterium]|nr:tRNA 4-thiouridine(8) synthase ThiI [Oscillospiraceae bacterium]